MFSSALFAFVAAVSSLVVVNGGVVHERQATFTYLTPQPTLGQSATTTTTGTSPSSSSASTTATSTTASSSTWTSSSSSSSATWTSISSSASGWATPPQSSSSTWVPPSSSSSATWVPSHSSSATWVPPQSTSAPSSSSPVSTTPTPTSSATWPIPPLSSATTTTPCPSSSISTSGPLPTFGSANCNGVQQWQASFAYTAGKQVIFNNQLYTAIQWTYNNAPPAHPDQWTFGGACAQPILNKVNCQGVAAWQKTIAYTAGSKVTFNGHLWSAVQWTQSNSPGDTSGSWQDLGACA